MSVKNIITCSTLSNLYVPNRKSIIDIKGMIDSLNVQELVQFLPNLRFVI